MEFFSSQDDFPKYQPLESEMEGFDRVSIKYISTSFYNFLKFCSKIDINDPNGRELIKNSIPNEINNTSSEKIDNLFCALGVFRSHQISFSKVVSEDHTEYSKLNENSIKYYLKQNNEGEFYMILFFTNSGFFYVQSNEEFDYDTDKIIVVLSNQYYCEILSNVEDKIIHQSYDPTSYETNNYERFDIMNFTFQNQNWIPEISLKDFLDYSHPISPINHDMHNITINKFRNKYSKSIGLIGHFSDIKAMFKPDSNVSEIIKYADSWKKPKVILLIEGNQEYLVLFIPNNFSPYHPIYFQASSLAYSFMKNICASVNIIPTNEAKPNNVQKIIGNSSSYQSGYTSSLFGSNSTLCEISNFNFRKETKLVINSFEELFEWIDCVNPSKTFDLYHYDSDCEIKKETIANLYEAWKGNKENRHNLDCYSSDVKWDDIEAKAVKLIQKLKSLQTIAKNSLSSACKYCIEHIEPTEPKSLCPKCGLHYFKEEYKEKIANLPDDTARLLKYQDGLQKFNKIFNEIIELTESPFEIYMQIVVKEFLMIWANDAYQKSQLPDYLQNRLDFNDRRKLIFESIMNLPISDAPYGNESSPRMPNDNYQNQMEILKKFILIHPDSFSQDIEKPILAIVKKSFENNEIFQQIEKLKEICKQNIDYKVNRLTHQSSKQSVSILEIHPNNELTFTVKISTNFDIIDSSFSRIVSSKDWKYADQPCRCEQVAILRAQSSKTKIINSWSTNDGILVLSEFDCETNDRIEKKIHLFFVKNNFDGRIPQEIKIEKDIMDPEVKMQAVFSPHYNTLILLHHKRNAKVLDPYLDVFRVDFENFKCDLLLSKSLEFLENYTDYSKSSYGLIGGISLNNEGTLGVFSLMPRIVNNELYTKYIIFSPLTLEFIETIDDTNLPFKNEDLNKYQIIPINLSKTDEFYEIHSVTTKRKDGIVREFLIKKEIKTGKVYATRNEPGNLEFRYGLLNGIGCPVICGRSPFFYISQTNENKFNLQIETNQTIFDIENAAKFVRESVCEFGLGEALKIDRKYPEHFIKVMALIDDEAKAKQFGQLIVKEFGGINIPLVINRFDQRFSEKRIKTGWRFFFNILNFPKVWFTVLDFAKNASENIIFKVREKYLAMKEKFPAVAYPRSTFTSKALSVTLVDFFEENGSQILSAFTGLQFSPLQTASISIGTQIKIIGDEPVNIHAMHMRQSTPFTHSTVFAALASSVGSAQIVILNIGKNVNVFLDGFRDFLKDISGMNDQFEEIYNEEILKKLFIVCDVDDLDEFKSQISELISYSIGQGIISNLFSEGEDTFTLISSKLPVIEIARLIGEKFEEIEPSEEFQTQNALTAFQNYGAVFGAFTYYQFQILEF